MLPQEIKNKVFLNMSHPVADIVEEEGLPFNKCIFRHWSLSQHLPDITFDDVIKDYDGIDCNNRIEDLFFMLHCSDYTEVYHLLLSRVRDAALADGKTLKWRVF